MCQSLAQVGETAGKIVELAVMSVDDVGELVELSCVCPLTMTTSSLSFPACSSKRRSCSSKRGLLVETRLERVEPEVWPDTIRTTSVNSW